MRKRILSVILLACMLFNCMPVAAFAEEAQTGCTHQHGESCGFAESSSEVACDKDCQPVTEGGEIVHADGCAYKAAVLGSDCTHKHNGACGIACTHSGGTATCKELAVCAVCGEEYGQLADHVYNEEGKCVCGETRICAHTGGTATCKDLAVCAVCGEEYGQLADHVYNEEGKCVCGEVQSCAHTDGTATVMKLQKEPESSGLTFAYSYDVYRSPPLPQEGRLIPGV